VGLLLVLPPAMFLSYRVARGMAQRVDDLLAAVAKARAGDLAARSPVVGEDELAGLQAGFNELAARLEEQAGRLRGLTYEQERLRRELRAERQRADGLLRAHRELAVEVTDELRPPLTDASSTLQLALSQWETTPPDELRSAISQAAAEVERLQRLTSDLVTISRIEAERLDLNIEMVAVGPLLRRMVDSSGPAAWESRRVHVTCQAADDLPSALADAGRLEQMVRDLLRSSLRRTPPGGEVRVTAGVAADRLRVCVEDGGEGIPAAALPRVWDRDLSSARGADGSPAVGFGLALVRELAEAMNGTVGVEPLPENDGNLFWVELPINEPGDD